MQDGWRSGDFQRAFQAAKVQTSPPHVRNIGGVWRVMTPRERRRAGWVLGVVAALVLACWAAGCAMQWGAGA